MKSKPPIIFEQDESSFRLVKSNWTKEDILSMDGVFYLKDIAGCLELNIYYLKKIIKSIRRRKKMPYKELGVGKIWGHHIVRMKVFSELYLTTAAFRVNKIPKFWDGNTLLSSTGTYNLTEVSRLIPLITARQLSYHAGKNPKSKEEMGIWKDPMLNRFLVNMPIFSTWLGELWEKSE